MIDRSPVSTAPSPPPASRSGGYRKRSPWGSRLLSLVLLAGMAGVAACEGDGGLGAPVLSELQGLPVPENAEIAARDAGTANAPILVYRVPGATHEQLKRWYAREMPVGRDWQGWSWCDSEENESGFFRYYHRPGEALLSVILAPDAGILLGYTTSGRC
jgi:hypothetical protein